MALDLTVELIRATVELSQPIGGGLRTVGAGFLVQAPTPEGRPRVVLVTAHHVLGNMPGEAMRVGWRAQLQNGEWKYRPQEVTIRGGGQPLWTRNPDRDIAVMEIKAPPEFARAAIPLAWLADDTSFQRYGIGPGDEMMALGFPEGLSSNKAGFPILRAGRVASYPLWPTTEFPSFLLDFRVFRGNSGGPVFLTSGLRRGPSAPSDDPPQLVAGLLSQQTTVGDKALDLGIVLHARWIRETIALLDQPAPPPQPPAQPPPAPADQTRTSGGD
jgi:S1-C subfamily serine protease